MRNRLEEDKLLLRGFPYVDACTHQPRTIVPTRYFVVPFNHAYEIFDLIHELAMSLVRKILTKIVANVLEVRND